MAPCGWGQVGASVGAPPGLSGGQPLIFREVCGAACPGEGPSEGKPPCVDPVLFRPQSLRRSKCQGRGAWGVAQR